ncbi:hypothetical protein CB0940_09849 [Cercospora beticola]|uniref:Uncharacterized protein n=1 Tax=Cercospora beticola TaxID=122368 RepID=A0A2G5HIE9_CERBT|nr:hypothetical protein CB0940_09849 [Cercospora beticola]PIA92341.1 hypothetical protein CB0940_09849 [Cercospora beticola]WPB05804.1 hypothetical protein RHO25_010458 [Cercospora beticola]CAK1365664.1 unnamed protein product [Cercospora beticola]
MFPVDSLPAAYHEEREAADAARRLAHIQQQQAKAQAAAVAGALKNASQDKPCTQSLLQQPQLSRPASTTVLGNIFQGFVRSSQSPPPAKGSISGCSTPVTTPPAKIITQADIERQMAERKRDADIVGSSPGWW